LPCNSQAVAQGIVDVSLAQELLKNKTSVQALINRINVMTKAQVSVIRQDDADLYLSIQIAAYEAVSVHVHLSGTVTLNSRDVSRSRLESLRPTIELEVRKLGAIAAREALIKGISAAVTAKNGRVVSNQRTRIDGRQLVLAV
jgi:hypothetical protein